MASKYDSSLDKPVNGEEEWKKRWSVFGVSISSVYYRKFSQFIGCNVNIVPANISRWYIESSLNDMRYDEFYEDKNNYDRILPQGILPRTILRMIAGVYYDKDYNILGNKDMSDESLNFYLKDEKRFIIKPTLDRETKSGYGVKLFHRENNRFIDTSGAIFSKDFLRKNYSEDFIIQEVLVQHDFFSQFNPTSVNGIRVVTYRSVKDEKIHVLHSIQKIGGKDMIFDNNYGVIVGIKDDGVLMDYVVSMRRYVKESCYNDIDFASAKFEVPYFEEIKKLAISLSQCYPHHRLIAYDIMVDSNNKIRLIESNLSVRSYYTNYFHCTVGPAYGEYTDEIMEHALKVKDQTHINISC